MLVFGPPPHVAPAGAVPWIGGIPIRPAHAMIDDI